MTRHCRAGTLWPPLLALLALAPATRAQQGVEAAPQDPAGAAAAPPAEAPPDAQDDQRAPLYVFEHAYAQSDPQRGDFGETIVFGGFRFRWPSLQLEIRGQHGLLWSDREVTTRAVAQLRGDRGPPRRGIDPPSSRRRLTPEVMHERVQSLLRALGQNAPAPDPQTLEAYEAPRFLYFEGDVIVLRQGVEVARCGRLWISPLDDRIVLEDAEVRLLSDAGGRGVVVTVRGERIERQGSRWTGRDLEVTTCEAGEPHIAVASGELEILEREGQFEVFSRDNTLQLHGSALLPLPDAHFFTGEQSQVPIQSVSAGYSRREGVQTRVELGMPFNGAGGALHEWLTGRPREEFRGDWSLGLGWIEKRGFPLDGELRYRGGELYSGFLGGMWLDDDFEGNLREIQRNLDGTLIDTRNRRLVRTRDRIDFGADTRLDLTAFYAGDAAVYSEFYRGDYRTTEVPETSVYGHHAADNVLLTVNGRFNLQDFSYKSNRALDDFFVEELPVATLDWLAQPIATTPWDTPIVLDTRTEMGQRRRKFDPTSPLPQDESRTTRFDQLVELSAPFALGPVSVRPYADARFTWWDTAGDGGASEDRVALAAGVRAGTRLSRTWSWLDEDGSSRGLRHVVSPVLTYANRYRVDGQPTGTQQYDAIDMLTEANLVRFEVRNLLQRMAPCPQARPGDAPAAAQPDVPVDFLFLDLAQDFWPDADRDNGGDTLGLFYYDFLIRPGNDFVGLPGLALGLYGDHDWQEGLRTLDAELGFGEVLGLDWMVNWRTDAVVSGALGVGARAQLLGRWSTYGNATYGFDRDEFLNYGVGLRRDDHDWAIFVGLNYDPFEDQVSFRVAFEPKLPGSRPPGRQTAFDDRFVDQRGPATW